MNLETVIDGSLWNEIRQNYAAGRFTDAIKDSVFLLTELIREKANLEGDGVSLVGQAFGGASPKIKVTKLESQSDKDIQAGTEAMLRGIYQAIRNPRSHEKYNDSKEEADAIIVFIDYLIKVINKSRAVFSLDDCISSVFDPGFVANERYSSLLVSEIPDKFKMDVLVEILRKKEDGDGRKLHHFFYALLNSLSGDQKKDAFKIISNELRTTSSDTTIRIVIQLLKPEDWPQIDEIPRLRIENRLIESIRVGRYLTSKGKCAEGALGTWASGLFKHMSLRREALRALANRLTSEDKEAEAYALQFFGSHLSELADAPPAFLAEHFKRKLAEGEQAYHDLVGGFCFEPAWSEPFKEAMEKFQPKADPVPESNDVPF